MLQIHQQELLELLDPPIDRSPGKYKIFINSIEEKFDLHRSISVFSMDFFLMDFFSEK
jgi:hypothetical protein